MCASVRPQVFEPVFPAELPLEPCERFACRRVRDPTPRAFGDDGLGSDYELLHRCTPGFGRLLRRFTLKAPTSPWRRQE